MTFTNLSNLIFCHQMVKVGNTGSRERTSLGPYSLALLCGLNWLDGGAPSCIDDIVNRIVLFTTLFGQRVQKWRTVEKHAHKKGVQCDPNFSVLLPSFMQITSLHNNSIQCSNFFQQVFCTAFSHDSSKVLQNILPMINVA